MPRTRPDLHVYWSKPARALMYHALPTDGGWLAYVLERVSLPHDGRTLAAELEARGYDLTTLRLSIRKKNNQDPRG